MNDPDITPLLCACLAQIEAYARANITTPTANIIVSTQFSGSFSQPLKLHISHFTPATSTEAEICTIGTGASPQTALVELLKQLTPCEPSAPSESSATPSHSTSGMQSPPVPSDTDTATTAPEVG